MQETTGQKTHEFGKDDDGVGDNGDGGEEVGDGQIQTTKKLNFYKKKSNKLTNLKERKKKAYVFENDDDSVGN